MRRSPSRVRTQRSMQRRSIGPGPPASLRSTGCRRPVNTSTVQSRRPGHRVCCTRSCSSGVRGRPSASRAPRPRRSCARSIVSRSSSNSPDGSAWLPEPVDVRVDVRDERPAVSATCPGGRQSDHARRRRAREHSTRVGSESMYVAESFVGSVLSRGSTLQDGIVCGVPVKGNGSVYTRCVYLSVPSGFSAFGKLMCSSSGTFAPLASPVQTLTNGVPFC